METSLAHHCRVQRTLHHTAQLHISLEPPQDEHIPTPRSYTQDDRPHQTTNCSPPTTAQKIPSLTTVDPEARNHRTWRHDLLQRWIMDANENAIRIIPGTSRLSGLTFATLVLTRPKLE